MKKLLFILLSSCFISAASAQIPFRFILQYGHPEVPTPLTVVLHSPDGQADTLFHGTLRTPSKSIRKADNDFRRPVNRELVTPGDYRLEFFLDTSFLQLPFTLFGDELLVEAGLGVDRYDSSSVVGYPAINLFRPAPESVKLYYLGADTLHRKILFHLVNRSDDTLFDGCDNNFPVDIGSYTNDLPPQINTHVYGFNSSQGPLFPGRSHKLSVKSYNASPGRCRANVCFFTDAGYHPLSVGVRHYGCVFYSRSVWREPSVQTVYVAYCDFFLTTLDLK